MLSGSSRREEALFFASQTARANTEPKKLADRDNRDLARNTATRRDIVGFSRLWDDAEKMADRDRESGQIKWQIGTKKMADLEKISPQNRPYN
jgi:hypothetical protein